MNRFIYIVVIVAALVAGVMVYKGATDKEQATTNSHVLVYQQPRVISAFELQKHTGDSFTNQQLLTKWSLVFFGYTSCPDICPTTLQALNFIYPELKKVNNDVQVLLVTVDPKRDDIERLSQYINYFHDEFIALRAEHDALFPFARNLGLMYAIADDATDPNYLVDHSASVVLINPQGQIAAIFKPQVELGQIPSIDTDSVIDTFSKVAAP